MIIIGFTGKKGHGKSTASIKAQEILESKGYSVVRINFKDTLISVMKEQTTPLIETLGKFYDMSVNELFDKKPPLMRRLMQHVGTDIYRSMDTDYWVNEWGKKVTLYDTTHTAIIVDDVRFINELAKVKEMNGIVYKIVATNKPISEDTHQSEIEMDSFDCKEIIAYSKEELEEKITNIMNATLTIM